MDYKVDKAFVPGASQKLAKQRKHAYKERRITYQDWLRASEDMAPDDETERAVPDPDEFIWI